MDFLAAVVADQQTLEVMQPGEGALDDPADAAEPGAVLGLAASEPQTALIRSLSFYCDGYPYFAHELGLEVARRATRRGRTHTYWADSHVRRG